MEETLNQFLHQASQSAILGAERLLAKHYDFIKQPPGKDLARYRILNPCFNVDHLDVILPRNYPSQLPKFSVDELLFGRIPHVDQVGTLCVWDESTSYFEPARSDEILGIGIAEAIQILRSDYTNSLGEEIAKELKSYLPGNFRFLSLLDDEIETAFVSVVWIAKKLNCPYSFIVAKTPEQALQWLERTQLSTPTVIKTATFLKLENPLLPPFPMTNFDFVSRVKALLGERFSEWEKGHGIEPSPLFIGKVRTTDGTVLLAWEHTRSQFRQRSGKSLGIGSRNGFRPGKAPVTTEYLTWSANEPVHWFKGDSATKSRLLSRTSLASGKEGSRSLAVIGLGSVGSQLCFQLCKSHPFDRVTLIDPDMLSIDNVLRHACPFECVGTSKVSAMKELLHKHCPWMEVVARDQEVFSALNEEDLIEGHDIVILATGNHAVESAISTWYSRNRGAANKLFRVWVGPELAGGDLVQYVRGQSEPDLSECIAKSAPGGALYEAGCNTGFIPYGGLRLTEFITWTLSRILNSSGIPCVEHWVPKS